MSNGFSDDEIKIPEFLPQEKRALLASLVEALSAVPGITAVVLGGSYARGTARPGSDLDVGLYYHEADPFPLDEIRRIARAISNRGEPTVTDFYGWGAWVNGGAWIQTEAGKVDFLYRNLDQVQQTINQAEQGIVQHDYDQQPAYGFYSLIYLTETQICIPLYDPKGWISRLKQQVKNYPPELKHRHVSASLWLAEFTLVHARGFAGAGDTYNTAGCLTRVAANLTQALFALNERYFLSDKKVMEEISTFPLLPEDYATQLSQVLACPGTTSEELQGSVDRIEGIWRQVVQLTGGLYKPAFQL